MSQEPAKRWGVVGERVREGRGVVGPWYVCVVRGGYLGIGVSMLGEGGGCGGFTSSSRILRAVPALSAM